MTSKKHVIARVSDSSDRFIKAWSNIQFDGYAKVLNGGCGECVIRYAVPFDYDGADLREGNQIDLLLGDADTLADPTSDFGARLLYRGYISLIERELSQNDERVTVHILGHYTLLSLDILRESDVTTLYSADGTGVEANLSNSSGDLAPGDIAQMARSVILYFNDQAGVNANKLYFLAEDAPDLGATATYKFVQKTYREALDILKSLAPANVYWSIDETGRFRFKSIPSAPTHEFVFGKHVSKLRVERSLEKLRNVVLVWNGDAIYANYEDSASIALYGRRAERINDFGIADTDAADAVGAKFLAENKDPSMKVIATIVDNASSDGANEITVDRPVYTVDDSDSACDAGNTLTTSGDQAAAQTFESNGGTLAQARFRLARTGSPTGNIYAKLYAITGSFGSTSTPTGSPLAVSEPVDVSTLPTTAGDPADFAQTLFRFTGVNQYAMSAATRYAIVLEYTGGDISNYVWYGVDGSLTHPGNLSTFTAATWTPNGSADLTFAVYIVTVESLTISQATGTDIEDIQPGHTCRFVGFSSTLSDIFKDNMLITEVRYSLGSVELTIELNKSGILDIQAQQGRRISDIGNGGLGIPDNYS